MDSKPIVTKIRVTDTYRDEAEEWTYESILDLFSDEGDLVFQLVRRCQEYEAEIERLRAIVDQLPTDAEGTAYPPPRALKGRCFYHPSYVGPAAILFSQLFWHSDGYWGIGSGGREVPFAECYPSCAAAENKRTQVEETAK